MTALETKMVLNFILCPSYHGATLLSILLNNHDNISCLGDTVPIKNQNPICSCGDPVINKCAFWENILKQIDNDNCSSLIPDMLCFSPNPFINYAFNTVIASISKYNIKIERLFPQKTDGFVTPYLKFIEIVNSINKTNFFIDGQKNILKVLLLQKIFKSDLKVNILHIVRDPRAYCYSVKRHSNNKLSNSAIKKWNSKHKKIIDIGKQCHGYHFVNYEELCKNPQNTMNSIFNFLELPTQEVCYYPKQLSKYHLIGNKMLRIFEGEIKIDKKWKTNLSLKEQNLIMSSIKIFSDIYT